MNRRRDARLCVSKLDIYSNKSKGQNFIIEIIIFLIYICERIKSKAKYDMHFIYHKFKPLPIILLICFVVLNLSCLKDSLSSNMGSLKNWGVGAVGSTDKLTGIAWSGNSLVAVGGGRIYSTANINKWNLQYEDNQKELHRVCWTGTQFVTVGKDIILKSPEGISWVEDEITGDFIDVAGHGDTIVVIDTGGVIYSNLDGQSWYKWQAKTNLHVVVRDPNEGTDRLSGFWAAGDSAKIYHSNNGIAWSGGWTVRSYDICDIIFYQYQNAYGPYFDALWLTFQGGLLNYGRPSAIDDTAQAMAYGGNILAVVGNNGLIAAGKSPGEMTHFEWSTELNLYDIVWIGSGFVAVGDSGIVISSPLHDQL